jgi:hypothetical protein
MEWLIPVVDVRAAELRPVAEYVSAFVPYSVDELFTRGMSVYLRKRVV